jgi:hypothetical protein
MENNRSFVPEFYTSHYTCLCLYYMCLGEYVCAYVCVHPRTVTPAPIPYKYYVKSKKYSCTPLHAMEAQGGRRGIAPTHT